MIKYPIRVLQIMGIVENGGIESVVMNYYKNIDKSRIQFDFIVNKGGNKNYLEKLKFMGAKIYEITPYNKNIILFTYDIYKVLKNNNYNIVHVNMNSLSVFALFAAWIAGVKIRILHNHTTDSNTEYLRTFIKRILRPFARIFANKYFACSKLAAIWMYGEKKVNNNEVVIVNNAINLKKFSFNDDIRQTLRRKLGLEGKFVIGHVGRFMKQKNHEFLIDIFAEIAKNRDDAELLLIGDGPLRTTIRDKVCSLNLNDKVRFLGSRKDVYELYNVMDAFVLPSYYEGLPVVGVEVQSNGLPFWCSDKITEEVIITDNIHRISLKKNVKYWADSIISSKRSYNQQKILKNLELAGFDIVTEAKKLEERYLKWIE